MFTPCLKKIVDFINFARTRPSHGTLIMLFRHLNLDKKLIQAHQDQRGHSTLWWTTYVTAGSTVQYILTCLPMFSLVHQEMCLQKPCLYRDEDPGSTFISI